MYVCVQWREKDIVFSKVSVTWVSKDECVRDCWADRGAMLPFFPLLLFSVAVSRAGMSGVCL